jgi:tRNA dimethylallyltransferase
MKSLIAFIGPTAIGKTELVLFLSRHFNNEIINADSRQIYRFMDIGTAKPSITERALIPHHLIDIVDPDEAFSLAIYHKLANQAIEDVQSRENIPILVGGSGQYIWSVIEGWALPQVPPNIEFRKNLEELSDERGVSYLYQELLKIDPAAAEKIMPTNTRRIIRALEIYQETGNPVSKLWIKNSPPFNTLIIGLTSERGYLYHKIDSRVDEMIKNGFIDEVKGLLAKGCSIDLPAMSSIGYRQIILLLEGKLNLADAIQQIKTETHRFARHQYAWFKLKDPRIHWFNVCDNIRPQINNLVKSYIG